jgi:hypothetical protein
MSRGRYRAIWEEANKQKVPEGHEIHHIDGNHDNNLPDNLMCVTIEQHFEIHKEQGDWAACQAILMRMERTADNVRQLREAASKHQNMLLKEGKHNFQKITKEERADISKKTHGKRDVAFLGIEDTVENGRRGGKACAEKKAGWFDTTSSMHGSKYVKGTSWWTNSEGKRKRAVEAPDKSWTRGMKFEG